MEYITAQKNSAVHITLIGTINEDAELPLQNILQEIKDAPQVIFNFARVTSINSLGVRAWVQFLRQAENGKQVFFEECPSDVVMQINMIPNFQSKAKILSFYASYMCESCNINQKVLVQTENLPPKEIPPPPVCSSCGENMESEELEDEYFAFLLR